MSVLGLYGKKEGMTHVYTDEGVCVPVTVISFQESVVTQVKTKDQDAYEAVQLTSGTKRHPSKPLMGHLKKSGLEKGFHVKEVDFTGDAPEVGSKLYLEVFDGVLSVDVTGTSKGKGFQGGVKRHNFRTQDATHGNSVSHRALGSTGQCQDPGRVFKGKKMPGQMGNKQRTALNLSLVRVDQEKGCILVKGAIPGSTGGEVFVKVSARQHKRQRS